MLSEDLIATPLVLSRMNSRPKYKSSGNWSRTLVCSRNRNHKKKETGENRLSDGAEVGTWNWVTDRMGDYQAF